MKGTTTWAIQRIMKDKGKNWERALTTVLLTCPKVVNMEYLGKKQGNPSMCKAQMVEELCTQAPPETGATKWSPFQPQQQIFIQLLWWIEQQVSEASSSMRLHQCQSSPHSHQLTYHCLGCLHDQHQNRWWRAQMHQKAYKWACGLMCPSNSAEHAWQLASEGVQNWSWIWEELWQHRQCLAWWWVSGTWESQQWRCRGTGTFLQLLHYSVGTWRWKGKTQG
jgi:hypothetical protein